MLLPNLILSHIYLVVPSCLCPFFCATYSCVRKVFENTYNGYLPPSIDEALELLKKGTITNFYQKDVKVNDSAVYLKQDKKRGPLAHPMYLNGCANHNRSLLSLNHYKFDGFLSVYGYQKQFLDHFNAHFEQLKAPFVHHLLKGERVVRCRCNAFNF